MVKITIFRGQDAALPPGKIIFRGDGNCGFGAIAHYRIMDITVRQNNRYNVLR